MDQEMYLLILIRNGFSWILC